MRASELAVQVCGGYGYVRDKPAEKWYRDAKLYTIFEGTSEIQRLVIGRALQRGRRRGAAAPPLPRPAPRRLGRRGPGHRARSKAGAQLTKTHAEGALAEGVRAADADELLERVLVAGQGGWHPDPWGQAEQRWWDGEQWTEHTHGAAAQQRGRRPSSRPVAQQPAARLARRPPARPGDRAHRRRGGVPGDAAGAGRLLRRGAAGGGTFDEPEFNIAFDYPQRLRAPGRPGRQRRREGEPGDRPARTASRSRSTSRRTPSTESNIGLTKTVLDGVVSQLADGPPPEGKRVTVGGLPGYEYEFADQEHSRAPAAARSSSSRAATSTSSTASSSPSQRAEVDRGLRPGAGDARDHRLRPVAASAARAAPRRPAVPGPGPECDTGSPSKKSSARLIVSPLTTSEPLTPSPSTWPIGAES